MKRVAVSNNPGESSSKRHKSGVKLSSALPDPFAPHLRTTARDVLQQGIGGGTAFLSGRAFMTWPAKSTFKKFQMQTEDGGSVQRFDIKLSGRCKAHFALLDFAATDCFEISLKSAVVERKQDSSKPYFFPMELEYSEGVLIRWTKRARKPEDNGTVVDTWALDEEEKRRVETARIAGENGLTWFTPPENSYPDQLLSTIITSANNASNPTIDSTPAPPVDRAKPPKAAVLIPPQTPALPAIAADRRPASINIKAIVVNAPIAGPSRQENPAAPISVPPKPSSSATISSSRLALNVGTHFQNPPRSTSTTGNRNSAVPAQRPAQPNNPSRPVSKHISPHSDTPPPAVEAAVTHQNEERSADTEELVPKLTKKQMRMQRRRAKELEAQGKSRAASPEASTSIAAPSVAAVLISPLAEASSSVPGPTTAAEGQRDPALDIQAGFQCDTETYTPLDGINNRGYGAANIMALVTSVRPPKKTTKNDWCTSLTLVDPSILQEDGICGSVEGQGSRINCFTRKYEQWLPSPQVGDVIILRGVKLGGPTLVGYHDQLKWVIFNPEKSKLHHGEKGDAPESEGLADGFGHEFSPFWDAQGPELTACLRYADWWRAVSKIVEKYAARVHQLGPEDAPSYAARGSYGRVHRLITDASPDQQPRGFFDCTVEIMKGFLNDNGVYSLYVTDYTPNSQMTPVQAEWCPPELGDRILKVEMWDSASALGQTMETGEYWFLRNCKMKVSRGGYLEGTMQEARGVVKLEESESDHHPHLAALLQRKSDCEQHNSERDLKFEHKLIGDVQVNGVQYFTCTVEMLHVDHNPNGVPCCYITDYTRHPDLPLISETNDWARRLERRIVKVVLWDGQVDMAKNIETGSFYTIRNLRLLPSTTGDYIQGRLGGAERLINKLRSGDSTNERLATLLQNKQRWEEGHPKIDHRQADSPGTTSTKDHPRNGFSTIREILSSQICPNKYRTTARIRDFFPFNLNNFVMRRCKYCDKRIDDQYKECRACLDVDSTVKHLFCFFFLMEDDDGRELLVSVSDECSLLGGLTPTDLDEDSEALQDLTNRLKPFIGNLVEAHEGISNGEEVDKEVPMLNISIDAWQNEGNAAVSYGLMNVQIA